MRSKFLSFPSIPSPSTFLPGLPGLSGQGLLRLGLRGASRSVKALLTASVATASFATASFATASFALVGGHATGGMAAYANLVPQLAVSPVSVSPASAPVPAASTAKPGVQSVPSAAENHAALADGVYLYGQAPQRDQLGQGYFVFEVLQGKVLGALYMPHSSFDCAKGRFEGQQLALTVVNSYDRTTNPYAIALERASTVSASQNPSVQPMGLQGFHALQVAESDRHILNVCKADFQKASTQK